MTPRRRLLVVLVPVIVATIGVASWVFAGRVALTAEPAIPTTRVARGNLEVNVYLNGELRAGKTAPVTPPAAGSTLRILSMVDTGTAVHAGDVVMMLDPADQEYAREQSRSQLLEAEQEIIKLRADTEVQTAQAAVELLTARFGLRRAEMDMATPPQFIGKNEARKRVLSFDEAKRHLAELESSAASRQAGDRAALASLEQKRNTARLAATRAEEIIGQLEVRAPIDGSVIVRENRDTTSIFFSGMTLPDYRIGDAVLPGRVVLEIIDPTEVQVRARVSEQDRPNVAPAQAARVRPDGLGGDWQPAVVESVAGLASRGDDTPVRQFDVTLKLQRPGRCRPGTTVQIIVAGPAITDVLHVPRQAIFERDGETVVYVREEGRLVARTVTVVGRNESRIALKGLAEGTEVALIDPNSEAKKPSTAKDKATGPVLQ